MSEPIVCAGRRRAVGVRAIRSAIRSFGLAVLFVCGAAHSGPVADIHSQHSANACTAPRADAILPFHVEVPDEAIADLRKRVLATRWPDKETVDDRSQGVQLAKLQELVRYWGTDHDWRRSIERRKRGRGAPIAI